MVEKHPVNLFAFCASRFAAIWKLAGQRGEKEIADLALTAVERMGQSATLGTEMTIDGSLNGAPTFEFSVNNPAEMATLRAALREHGIRYATDEPIVPPTGEPYSVRLQSFASIDAIRDVMIRIGANLMAGTLRMSDG